MKIKFCGAAQAVTGSCHLVQFNEGNILVDCGMRQGSDEKNMPNGEFPFDPKEITALLVTHAHIDHTGLVPLLTKRGFKGPIFSTSATAKLCEIMLVDSAHIQEQDAEDQTRKNLRAGKPPVEPLYSIKDAEEAQKQFKPVPYGKQVEVCPGVQARFTDVGHLLGSAAIELWITEEGKTARLAFSGDVGRDDRPIINDPDSVEGADYLIMESTYGDRNHGATTDAEKEAEFAAALKDGIARGGNIVIPSFAVGRTQELLYYIKRLLMANTIPGLERVPVYLDSPLGIKATKIYESCTAENYDAEAQAMFREGDLFEFPTLNYAQTADESKLINTRKGCNIIISSSGMCDAGRIRHHLKHNLYRADSTVIFAGYQAVGTLGRMLVDGVKKVKLFGEQIIVNANIVQIEGFSGHAGKDELLRWIQEIPQKPSRIFLVHGEKSVIETFASAIRSLGYSDVDIPEPYEEFDLATGVVRREPAVEMHRQAEKTVTSVESLLNRMAKLMQLAAGAQGEKAERLAADLDALLRKWD
ncbi:MAG: MBL fold metallo-hydrolase [Clostridia bacterium]|nr:MBL fold metallo-hydrolase [Candidatus Pelethousia sp.]NCB30179.1 MBL fold metallo-hydrolase [Clostridia bacterium]